MKRLLNKFLFVFSCFVVVLGFTFLPSPKASAAFNPNEIIDDPIFENSNSMNADAINALLNSYGSSCISPNSGFVTPLPLGYSGGAYQFSGNVNAGQAISAIAQHYNLSPQVILSTLQKEQSIPTGGTGCHPNTPDSSNTFTCTINGSARPCTTACPYSGGCIPIAMGYDCPGNCAAALEGFSEQISGATWQLRFNEERAYGNLSGYSGFDSGDDSLSYSGPMTAGYRQRSSSDSSNFYDGSFTTSDGTSVHIANGSTASLYAYTPYISGNTNFYNIFLGWFGSPNNVCGSDIVDSGTSPVHKIGDFNVDGRVDAAIFRPSDGCWHIRGVGDAQFGQSGDIPVPGDYNGDGRTDVAVFRPNQVVNGESQWHIRGVGDFGFGHPGDIPVPGDYNGDGKTDIAVYRPSEIVNGEIMWHISGVGDVGFGHPGDIPVPGDYNGDGKTDIAVFRPSTGDWHIRGVGDYNGYGQSGDIPVPADYNGDNRTDAAVFRPSQVINGEVQWHIRGVGDFGFGHPGDIPVPGDYNGTGTAKIAVFRNGDWHIRGVGDYNGYGQSGDLPANQTLNVKILDDDYTYNISY